jgi:hypothetical protein
MARKKITRSATAVNRTGELGAVLQIHAYERIRHLFLFLFAVDAACKLVNAELNKSYKGGSLIQEAATHQVDTGLRDSDQIKDVFDEYDVNVVKLQSSAFNRIDAAHFCNLGLKSSPWSGLTSDAESLKEDHAVDMMEYAEVFTSNTMWLPQRVNIGPDRIIDQQHYALGKIFLGDGNPIFSKARLRAYNQAATVAMGDYKVKALSAEKYGLAACCDYYLSVYSDRMVDDYFKGIGGNIWSECMARKMKTDDYIVS